MLLSCGQKPYRIDFILSMSERLLTIDQFLTTPPIEIRGLFEHPTCTDFERRFRSVLGGNFDSSGELKFLGIVAASITQTRTTGLDQWGIEESQEYQGIIKNPNGDQHISSFVGICSDYFLKNRLS